MIISTSIVLIKKQYQRVSRCYLNKGAIGRVYPLIIMPNVHWSRQMCFQSQKTYLQEK